MCSASLQPSATGYEGTVRLTIKARPRSYTAAMPTARDPLYQRHRFPPEVISHAVWLYLWTVPAMQGFLRQSANARLQLSIRSFDATPLLTLMRYADWRPIILAGLGAR